MLTCEFLGCPLLAVSLRLWYVISWTYKGLKGSHPTSSCVYDTKINTFIQKKIASFIFHIDP